MKRLSSILALITIASFCYTCDDVFEEDITDEIIQTTTPTEGMTILGNTINFQWMALDGADDYRVQISHAETQVLVVDSLMETTHFVYNLSQGEYQWRVRGENFAYASTYTFPIHFTVELSEDLSNQQVVLLTPNNDLYTNNINVICTWESLPTADTYTFELDKLLNGQQTIYQEADILGSSFTIPTSLFSEDAEYVWKIKAVNESSQSAFSTRTLFIDTVAPNQPTVSSPTDDATVSTGNVTFNWVNGTDTGNVQSDITYTLEIASDAQFTSILASLDTPNNSYQYNFSSAGVYYWRVQAIDEASNESDYSIVRTLTVE